jgi:hypothetical protein
MNWPVAMVVKGGWLLSNSTAYADALDILSALECGLLLARSFLDLDSDKC